MNKELIELVNATTNKSEVYVKVYYINDIGFSGESYDKNNELFEGHKIDFYYKKFTKIEKYNTLLSLLKEFFNSDLKGDLNKIALEKHNLTLDKLIVNWCKKNSNLEGKDFIELVTYLKNLNTAPHSITEMQEMYDFVYEYTED